jgi:hypothetical protein
MRQECVAAVAAATAAVAIALGGARVTASAQGAPVTLDQIVAMASDGRDDAAILAAVRADCVTFPVDSAAVARLRSAGVSAGVIAGLVDACYFGSTLAVTTEPSGAVVRIDGKRVGESPWQRPVRAPATMLVEVGQEASLRRHSVVVPQGQSVTVHFELARDTLQHPAAPSPDEAERLREVLRRGEPSIPPPEPPVPPGRRSSLKSWLVGGVIGAALGAAAGVAVCSDKFVRYRFDPSLGYSVPDGTELRLREGCAAAAAGVGFASGGAVSDFLSRRRYGRRLRAYERASATYATEVARWEAQAQANRRRMLPGVEDQVRLADERDRIARENERIRSRNRSLPDPIIQTRPAERLPRAGG